MRIHYSRPIPGSCGYARPRPVGALTTVWVGRSDCAGAVLMSSVVKTKSLEGKQ
jgi:hypothetical protein